MTPTPCVSGERVIHGPSSRRTLEFPSKAALRREYIPGHDEEDEYSWCPERHIPDTTAWEDAVPLEWRGVTEQIPDVRRIEKLSIKQTEFWKKQTTFKNTVAAKLRQEGCTAEASKLEQCHTVYTYAVCGDCNHARKFPNRCDLFYCPECADHLQRHIELEIGWWAGLVAQPKHLVLTIRNIPDLTPGHIDELRAMFSKLRRSAFAKKRTMLWLDHKTGRRRKIKAWRRSSDKGHTIRSEPWRSGLYRLQCTNEGRGWHLHIHCLIDSDFIHADLLKEKWASITNGYGYICHVRDARPKDYLREVTRYVVKSSELAAWTSSDVRTFVEAFDGKRTFGVFGTLYAARTQFAEFIAGIREARPRCNCGSDNVAYYDEFAWLRLNATTAPTTQPRPPPASNPQLSLIPDRPRWPD